MAILRPHRGWPAILGLVALLYLGGCVLVDALMQSERPFAFSHALHVEEQGLECADCHSRWEDSEDPGMPRAAQCALCHAELDAEKPIELRVAPLFDGESFRAARAGHQSDEILFSHQQHATRGLECTACHGASAGPRLSDCAACHAEIRTGAAPPSHRANWTRYHGTLVRGRASERLDQCALCHQPADCTNCHKIELPANHNNYWRRRGHGLTASMDRDSCATCHESDSCQRCHDEIRPMSHVGMWGEPRDRHCLACHEPLRSNSCVACHAATPSHDQATPLPPDHLPGMDCRSCHGQGQPLPHEDNGQTCTSCHR